MAGKRYKIWLGSLGPIIYIEGKGRPGPLAIEESDDAGTFRSSRPPRNVATTSTETQTFEAEEQLASQNEVGNGPYQNYLAAHRWVPSTQNVTPV